MKIAEMSSPADIKNIESRKIGENNFIFIQPTNSIIQPLPDKKWIDAADFLLLHEDPKEYEKDHPFSSVIVSRQDNTSMTPYTHLWHILYHKSGTKDFLGYVVEIEHTAELFSEREKDKNDLPVTYTLQKYRELYPQSLSA